MIVLNSKLRHECKHSRRLLRYKYRATSILLRLGRRLLEALVGCRNDRGTNSEVYKTKTRQDSPSSKSRSFTLRHRRKKYNTDQHVVSNVGSHGLLRICGFDILWSHTQLWLLLRHLDSLMWRVLLRLWRKKTNPFQLTGTLSEDIWRSKENQLSIVPRTKRQRNLPAGTAQPPSNGPMAGRLVG